MNVIIILEHRFLSTPDNQIWTPSTFSYSFWQRYLDVFESVTVIARVKDVSYVPEEYKRADGANVKFVKIPYYVGPWQFIFRMKQILHILKESITPYDAVILRVPSTLANLAVPFLRKRKQPFALEVVGDPWEVFSSGTVNYFLPLRMFARWWFTNALKRQCKEAAAISYVTQFALQKRYPPAEKHLNIFYYSDVEIKNTSFINFDSQVVTSFSSFESINFSHIQNKQKFYKKRSFNLITIAMLDQLYKGVDILIDAVALCIKRGLDVYLNIIGDGKYRLYLENRVRKRKLEKRVHFLGYLPAGDPIYTQLDRSDLFVLASRTEGLPRAMIEAMARGLPCIGTTIGGIPELLPPEDMVPPNDAKALARKIEEVLNNPERMLQMSLRNLQKASEFREEAMRKRRLAFYLSVRNLTENWIKNLKVED